VTVTAAAAGIWQLGDLTVNRIGFGRHAPDRGCRLRPRRAGRPWPVHQRAAPLPTHGRRQAAG